MPTILTLSVYGPGELFVQVDTAFSQVAVTENIKAMLEGLYPGQQFVVKQSGTLGYVCTRQAA